MKLYNSVSLQDKKEIRGAVLERLALCRLLNMMNDLDESKTDFIEKVKTAIDSLPGLEKELINIRYMDNDSEYITDTEVYNDLLSEPISPVTYSTIRERAIMKLAIYLDIENGVEIEIRKKEILKNVIVDSHNVGECSFV